MRIRRGLRAPSPEPRRPGAAPEDGLSDPDDFDPFEGEELKDSWEPPQPALGGPAQLLAAILAVFLAALVLLGVVGAVAWLFRLG